MRICGIDIVVTPRLEEMNFVVIGETASQESIPQNKGSEEEPVRDEPSSLLMQQEGNSTM